MESRKRSKALEDDVKLSQSTLDLQHQEEKRTKTGTGDDARVKQKIIPAMASPAVDALPETAIATSEEEDETFERHDASTLNKDISHNDGGHDTAKAFSEVRLQAQRKLRKRKMDVVYARRRRERERGELETLRERFYELKEKNLALEEDNKRMEEILTNARSQIILHKHFQQQQQAHLTTPQIPPSTLLTTLSPPPVAIPMAALHLQSQLQLRRRQAQQHLLQQSIQQQIHQEQLNRQQILSLANNSIPQETAASRAAYLTALDYPSIAGSLAIGSSVLGQPVSSPLHQTTDLSLGPLIAQLQQQQALDHQLSGRESLSDILSTLNASTNSRSQPSLVQAQMRVNHPTLLPETVSSMPQPQNAIPRPSEQLVAALGYQQLSQTQDAREELRRSVFNRKRDGNTQ